jgi:mRNA interferase RelE/StbE
MAGTLYGFAYSKKALANLKSLQKRERRQVIKKIQALAADPHPPGSKLVTGVRDSNDPVYRVRSGDYRILYVVKELTVCVLDIDHRKDIYR